MHCFLWFIRITSGKLCASQVIQLVVSKIRRLQSLQGGEGQPLCSKVQLCPTDFRASTPAVIPGRILRIFLPCISFSLLFETESLAYPAEKACSISAGTTHHISKQATHEVQPEVLAWSRSSRFYSLTSAHAGSPVLGGPHLLPQHFPVLALFFSPIHSVLQQIFMGHTARDSI